MCDTENDVVQEKLSYTYIGHFSRYMDPGAKRISSTKYTDKVSVVSLKNPNGSIIIVLLNRSKEDIPVSLRLNGEVAEFSVPAESIVTGIV
jgi:glucosylceramidase